MLLMQKDIKIFIEHLRSLAKIQNPEVIQEELGGLKPQDLAEAFQRINVTDGLNLLRQLSVEMAGDILTQLPTETAKQYIEELPDSTIAAYLQFLPINDALEMRKELGQERFSSLLEIIPRESAYEIRRLLTYPEDSVGRIMTEAYVKVSPETTMGEILNMIRGEQGQTYETIDAIYVLGEGGHLVGVLSLRRVIRALPEEQARSIMIAEVISAHPTSLEEDAARLLIKYDFSALPIVDEKGRMVGILSASDAHDILSEADTEDVLKLGGVSGDAEAYISLGVFHLAKRRIPWLLGLFIAETFTGAVLRYYGQGSDSLNLSPVTFFIPLLIGAGGNSGSQTTTTITRALAIGEITSSDAWLVFKKEILTALLVGVTLGIVGFVRAQLWGTSQALSWVVGLAIPCIVLWATAVGSLLPIAAKKVGVDPAVMSAPFISTFVDATGLIIYLELVRSMVGI